MERREIDTLFDQAYVISNAYSSDLPFFSTENLK